MDGNIRGILCVVSAMFLFSLQDMLFKFLSQDGSILQTIVVRGAIGMVLISVFLLAQGKRVQFGTAYPVHTIVRGILFTIGFMTFYLSLSLLELAEANALFFVSPIFVSVLSVWFFGMKVGVHRIAAIATGFIGMLLIVRPSPDLFHWASLLPIFCAFTYANSMLLAKRTGDRDDSFQQVMHMYIAGILIGSLTSSAIAGNSSAIWAHPDLAFLTRGWNFSSGYIWGVMVLVGLTGSIGLLLLITAYRVAEPMVIAPFEYTVLINAILWGYLFFDETPDLWLFGGIVLIVGSGLYIFFREMVKKKPIAVDTSLRN